MGKGWCKTNVPDRFHVCRSASRESFAEELDSPQLSRRHERAWSRKEMGGGSRTMASGPEALYEEASEPDRGEA